MKIEIPARLNGKIFFEKILPDVYRNIIAKNYEMSFDMSQTELANPEGIVDLLSTALMIKNKYKKTTNLIIPNSDKLLNYLELTGFFQISTVPNCEVFTHNFQPYRFLNREKYSQFIPKIYGIFSFSEFNTHYDNVDRILSQIKKQLGDSTGVSTNKEFDRKIIYDNLQASISQLIRNVLEHNQTSDNCSGLGYYMAQRTPYDTIELVFSDCGQGYWKRIVEMINEDSDSNVHKYHIIKEKLLTNKYLFQEHKFNPNLISIEAAVNYRDDSDIPGLFQIKRYALNKNGHFFIHSGNYSINYTNKSIDKVFYEDSYFSGAHIKLEIPINE